jgi:hypothetical protein
MSSRTKSASKKAIHLGPNALVSAIRFCLHQGLHVQLLEWMPASTNAGNIGFTPLPLLLFWRVVTAKNIADVKLSSVKRVYHGSGQQNLCSMFVTIRTKGASTAIHEVLFRRS